MKFLFAVLVWMPLTLAATLFDTVEAVNIGLGGYRLGAALTDEQKRIAAANPKPANVEGTYKFEDGDIAVVADKATDRVVLVYQSYRMVDSGKMKQLVGNYIGRFEEPTTVTHGNIIYWFYKADGTKVTLDEFEAWRGKMHPQAEADRGKSLAEMLQTEATGRPELGNLVTVKFSTDKSIGGKEAFLDATAYLIISSEQLLKERYAVQN